MSFSKVLRKENDWITENKVPFSSNIIDFIEKSRECQLLYVNCEGSHKRRKMCIKNGDLVFKRFIYNTLYYRESSESCSKDEGQMNSKSVQAHVELLKKKMLELSPTYQQTGTIHFSVIWVYYFDYKHEVMQATAVFKIYTKNLGNEGVYLDVRSMDSYQSWDSYLDNTEFPSSFLCVPRGGEYNFEYATEHLELEFFCSRKKMKIWKNIFDNHNYFDYPYSPYSQIAILPWIKKICSKSLKHLGKFFEAMKSIGNRVVVPTLVIVVFFCIALIKLNEFLESKNSKVALLSDFSNDVLMLLNSTVTEEFKLKYQSWFGGFLKATNQECSENLIAPTMVNDDESTFVQLIRQLNSPAKNWQDILEKFFFLLRKSLPLLTYWLRNCNCPLLHVILDFLKALKLASNLMPLLDPSFDSSGKNKDLCKVLQSVPSTSKHCTVEKAEHDSYLSNLKKDLTTSACLVSNMIVHRGEDNLEPNDSSEIVKKELSFETSSTRDFHVETDGVAIWVLYNVNLTRLTGLLKRYYKEGFTLKDSPHNKRNSFFLIESSGREVGSLFFPAESVAVVLIPGQIARPELQGDKESELSDFPR